MSTVRRMNTKILTEVAMILALGFVLKLVTDIFTRTALSFLFIDFLMIVAIVIIYRNPTFKVALSVAVIQLVMSATLFTTTDIWFVRPFIVLIAFGVIKFALSRKWKDKTKFLFSFFFTAKFSILFVSLVLAVILFINPTFIGLDAIMSQVEGYVESGLITPEHYYIFQENIQLLLVLALALVGLVYAYLPALVSMLIGLFLYRIINRNK